jgi:hypothetical protein
MRRTQPYLAIHVETLETASDKEGSNKLVKYPNLESPTLPSEAHPPREHLENLSSLSKYDATVFGVQ